MSSRISAAAFLVMLLLVAISAAIWDLVRALAIVLFSRISMRENKREQHNASILTPICCRPISKKEACLAANFSSDAIILPAAQLGTRAFLCALRHCPSTAVILG